jgi:hypothetical protein
VLVDVDVVVVSLVVVVVVVVVVDPPPDCGAVEPVAPEGDVPMLGFRGLTRRRARHTRWWWRRWQTTAG